jgi:hypothetical protein
MSSEVCSLINNAGRVSCFLSDINGEPVDPSGIRWEEVRDPQGREDVSVSLNDGGKTVLQKVVIEKSGFIVVEVTDGVNTCLTEPIPFSETEHALLCAPEGTEIRCRITDVQCFAFVQCRNGIYEYVDIVVDFCQDIQAVAHSVVEVEGQFSEPREPYKQRCYPISNPTGCRKEKRAIALEEDINQQYKESKKREIVCVNTEKVYDWIVKQTKIKIRRFAEDTPFICDICLVDIFVPAHIICEDMIMGRVECNGGPVEGAVVFLSASPNNVTFSPNPVVTDALGEFETVVTVPVGTEPTDVIITASTVVNGHPLSTSLPTIVRCLADPCILFLFGPPSIECTDIVSGRIRCGNTHVPNVDVTLTANPPIVTFDPNPTVTDAEGSYFSGVSVPSGTPPTDVDITASATVDGQLLSETITVNVSCVRECVLTLEADETITCQGQVTGTLTCNGQPIADASIDFSIFPDVGAFNPNPAVTAGDGTFVTTLVIPEGTPLISTAITAMTIVNGETVMTTIGRRVECPAIECPCKFRIGVQGGSAPATANITVGGVPSILTGTINVTAIQCFTAAPMCNPAIDNFNVAFGNGGNTINFVAGRRIEIECEGNTFARVRGIARVTGNVFPDALFEVTITLTIGAGNIGVWTVDGTDFHGNTFTTTFTAGVTPITFIGDCNETP